MKNWAKFSFLVLFFIFLSFVNIEARVKYQGIAGKGGKNVQVSTTNYKLEETYPLCIVTVYLTGTTTLASIYSDNNGSVKANPFSSNSADASYSFYANSGRYDIKFSGTGVASPFTKADIVLTEVSYAEFPVESYGAITTSTIQTAINAARDTGGGNVSITTAGTYNLIIAGNDPYYTGHKYCLEITGDNITFTVGAGVILQLANNQQINGAPVNIFITRSKHNITFDGEGTISGNTAGQTGYTDGYSQIDHGLIISFYGSAGTGANSDITVKDLTLINHFSNPINIDRNGSATKNSNILISNVHTSDCGEGIQVISSDDVIIENCIVDSPNHVAVGDAIEISMVNRFHIVNNIVKNHHGGSAVDVFQSSNGIVENLVSDDNIEGVGIESFDITIIPKNILVDHIIVINPYGNNANGVNLTANTLDNIKIKNLQMRGTSTSFGMQIAANGAIKGAGSIIIEDCDVDGGSQGILIAAAFPNLTIKGGSYRNMVTDGIAYVFQGNGLLAADVKNLNIVGVRASDNGRYGILITNSGYTVPTITGTVSNCYLENNAINTLQIAGAESSGLTANGNIPNTITGFASGSGLSVFGIKYVIPTGGDASSFQFPSKNQEIEIKFTEARVIIDRRQAGGNNIDLAGGVNFAGQIGDILTLQFSNDTSKWYEVNRSVNGTTIAGVFTSIANSGQYTSTLATGTAPLVVTSTTPVSNLNLTSHPKVYNISGTLQTSTKIVTGTGTLSTGTIVVTFSSNAIFANTNYICSGANQTNANAFKIVNTSTSSITITGTGSDVIGFQCIGQ